MKNKVLKTIGYIVGITWLFTACALDDEVYGMTMFNGGKIQYVRYPISYNREAVKTLVRRAMQLGFYEGVNLSLAYCDDCGHQELKQKAVLH